MIDKTSGRIKLSGPERFAQILREIRKILCTQALSRRSANGNTTVLSLGALLALLQALLQALLAELLQPGLLAALLELARR